MIEKGHHGEETPLELDALLDDDPYLRLVNAPMHEWLAAQPECKCEALCKCDEEG
jgi:hypothetical protein